MRLWVPFDYVVFYYILTQTLRAYSAGQLLALLFEDLFKTFNANLKAAIDKVLKKPSRTTEFDAFNTMQFQGDHITAGFVRAISPATGPLNVSRRTGRA